MQFHSIRWARIWTVESFGNIKNRSITVVIVSCRACRTIPMEIIPLGLIQCDTMGTISWYRLDSTQGGWAEMDSNKLNGYKRKNRNECRLHSSLSWNELRNFCVQKCLVYFGLEWPEKKYAKVSWENSSDRTESGRHFVHNLCLNCYIFLQMDDCSINRATKIFSKKMFSRYAFEILLFSGLFFDSQIIHLLRRSTWMVSNADYFWYWLMHQPNVNRMPATVSESGKFNYYRTSFVGAEYIFLRLSLSSLSKY